MPKILTYTAAGGVICNVEGTEVLLLIRPACDEVRLPKGHVEIGESLAEAALREVIEETGYDDLEIVGDLGEQLVVFTWKHNQIQRTEHYFFMHARSKRQVTRPKADQQQFFPVWTPWEEALAALTFDAEQEWLRRARANLHQGTLI